MKRENSYISNFKAILRLIIFCACLLPFFWYFGDKYKAAAAHNTVNYFTKNRFDEFFALERDSLDMVFIGSSHSYCSFDPANFDAIGLSSFQLGTPLQHPDTSYFLLKEVLKTQSPEIVVMEVYWDMLDDPFTLEQANSFFVALNDPETEAEYVREVFPAGDRVKYAVDPIRYQKDFFAYAGNQAEETLLEKYGLEKKAASEQTGVEEYRGRGYVYCDYHMLPEEFDATNQFKGFDGLDWDFDTDKKEYLEKIIALCRERGISLVFVTAPVAPVSMGYIEHYDAVNGKVSDFARRNRVPYIDYNIVNRDTGFLTNDHFRDDAHLNDGGVKLLDADFSQWLLENIDF